jgi:hypothetical protein
MADPVRGDFDEDEDDDGGGEILAFAQAQLADIPDWALHDWQHELLERELTIMASNKRRPTKRAARTKTAKTAKTAKRNPQDMTLRNGRATESRFTRVYTKIGSVRAQLADVQARLAKLEEVIAARVVGKP